MFLVSDLLETQKDISIMYVDNQSAIRFVKKPEFHRPTKYIDIRYCYICKKFSEGMFSLDYMSSTKLADIMNKPIPRIRFHELGRLSRFINIDVLII